MQLFFVKDTHRLCILKGTKWPLLSSWAAPGKYMSGLMSRGNTDTWWQRRVLFPVGGGLQHRFRRGCLLCGLCALPCSFVWRAWCRGVFWVLFCVLLSLLACTPDPSFHWSSFFHQRPLQSPLFCRGARRCCWARFCCLLAQFWEPPPPCSPNQCVNRANSWYTADSWCHDCDPTCSLSYVVLKQAIESTPLTLLQVTITVESF